jgi:hypothetical protein
VQSFALTDALLPCEPALPEMLTKYFFFVSLPLHIIQ